MRENFAKAFGLGLAAVAVIVGVIMFMQKGAHMDLPGQIKVRTVPTGDDAAIALVDLHVTNPSDYNFMIGDITVTVETNAGDKTEEIVSRDDAKRLFDSMPDSGPFHPALYTKANIPPRTTGDYTLVAQFSVPERMLKDRKRFVVHVQEVNGTTMEYSEK